MRTTFLVEFYNNRWRINVDGEHYGSFPTQTVAEAVSMELMQLTGELGARVVVRDVNGDERVIFDPIQLVEQLWENLSCYAYGVHSGPSNSEALLDEVTNRVLECAEYELSGEDIVDVVLASFGVRRTLTVH
jgi:hypothetical protein